MRTTRLILAGFLLSSAAANALSDHKDLSNLFDELSVAAEEGASIQFFGFTELDRDTTATSDCQVIPSQSVKDSFEFLSHSVLGDEISEHTEGLEQFGDYIGKSYYQECKETTCQGFSCSEHRTYLSVAGGPDFQFEIGYED